MASSQQSGTALPLLDAAETDARSPGQRLVAARRRIYAALDVSVHRDIGALADIWREFEQTADCTVFQSFAWHRAWQATIGKLRGAVPAIVVGRRDGRMLFMFPFAVVPRLFGRALIWSAGDVSDYNAPLLAHGFSDVVEKDHFLSLFENALKRIAAETPFDSVILDKMPERIGGQANPFMALATDVHPDGAHRMALTGDWESFYAAKRSSGTRRNDRKKRKRLGEFGAVAFVAPTAPAEVQRNLDVMFEQKTEALKEMGAHDFFGRPGHRDFFTALAMDPENRGAFQVSQLRVGEDIAAASFGADFRGAFYHLIASYCRGPLASWGPGAAHLRDLIAQAIGRGCTAFDFTLGDESYKLEWCEVHLVLHDHRAAATWRGIPETYLGRALTALKRIVKQNPKWRMTALRWRAKILGRAAPAPVVPEKEIDAEAD